MGDIGRKPWRFTDHREQCWERRSKSGVLDHKDESSTQEHLGLAAWMKSRGVVPLGRRNATQNDEGLAAGSVQ